MPEQVSIEPTISVPYEEITDIGSAAMLTQNQFTDTRVYKTSWANSLQFAQDVLGNVFATGSDGSMLTILGIQHPVFPQARAHAARIEARGTNTGDDPHVQTWTFAHIHVEYAVPEFTPVLVEGGDATVLASERLDVATEFVTLPNQDLYWYNPAPTVATPLSREQRATKLLAVVNWIYTIHSIRVVPKEVFTLAGHVNNDNVTSPTFGWLFAQDELLYNGPRLSRQITSQGNGAFNLEMSFSIRDKTGAGVGGWNQFWKDGDGPKQIQKKDGTIVNPYTRSDFSNLLLNPRGA